MSSFGESLKRERELRQIPLREIAEATKINLRYLEALERNDFRHLPGGVFNKGFVRAYAQHIGIDPEAMVDAYLEEIREQEMRGQARERERRVAARSSAPAQGEQTEGGGSRPAGRRALAGIAVIAILALLGAAGWAGWRFVRKPRPAEGAAETPAARPAVVRIVVDAPVDGTISCDGEAIVSLRDLEIGVPRDVSCRGALVLRATDGGAVRVGAGGAEPAPAGAAGVPLSGLSLQAAPETPGRSPGARP